METTSFKDLGIGEVFFFASSADGPAIFRDEARQFQKTGAVVYRLHPGGQNRYRAEETALVRKGPILVDAYRRLAIARADYNAVRTAPRVRALSQEECDKLSARYRAEYGAAVKELRGLGVSID